MIGLGSHFMDNSLRFTTQCHPAIKCKSNDIVLFFFFVMYQFFLKYIKMLFIISEFIDISGRHKVKNVRVMQSS